MTPYEKQVSDFASELWKYKNAEISSDFYHNLIRKHFPETQPAGESEDTKLLSWLEANSDRYSIDCNLAFSTPFRIIKGSVLSFGGCTVISCGEDLRQALRKALTTHKEGVKKV